MDRHRKPPSGAATIRDVAALAGVSTATVSRVMSGARPVRADLADKVREAAAALHYRPSALGRALSLGSLRHVGVVMPQLSNPYFGEILERLSRRAQDAGFRLLIADGGGVAGGEAAAAHELQEHVDGLLLLSTRMTDDDLRGVVATDTPTVLVHRELHGLPVSTVVIDNARAITALCGHLHALGHRHVAYLSGPAEAWQDHDRWRALSHLTNLGMEATRVEGSGDLATARAAVDEVLQTGATAVICFNDLSAIGLISALQDRGVDCPRQISVTGFDDLELARHVQPSVTTVSTSKAAIADHAWEFLEEALHGSPTPRRLAVDVSLIARGSTGTAARDAPVDTQTAS